MTTSRCFGLGEGEKGDRLLFHFSEKVDSPFFLLLYCTSTLWARFVGCLVSAAFATLRYTSRLEEKNIANKKQDREAGDKERDFAQLTSHGFKQSIGNEPEGDTFCNAEGQSHDG